MSSLDANFANAKTLFPNNQLHRILLSNVTAVVISKKVTNDYNDFPL